MHFIKKLTIAIVAFFLAAQPFLLPLAGIAQTAAVPTAASQTAANEKFTVVLQTRDAQQKIVVKPDQIDPNQTAVIVVDMWDRHWCKSFTEKVGGMVEGMNEMLAAARKLGMQVIFAPSETMEFYKDVPQRRRIQQMPAHPLQAVKAFDPPSMPWLKTGGCECSKDRPCKGYRAWTRQHKDLVIDDNDVISDNAQEINNFCREKGIQNLLYAGVASNMCVSTTRSFSVIPMTRYGYRCILVRDLAEAISGNGYDPDLKKELPTFTPEQATAKVTEHFERFFAPTISADQLLVAAGIQGSVHKPGPGPSMFSLEEVRNYIPKGPTVSFRQLCYDYNWVGRDLSDLPLKFTEATPVEYAELSKKINLDAALVLAVPHHGYTTYESKVGVKFPGIKGDWFGEVVKELHKRDIRALGYITLGTNWKFMRDHLGQPYISASMKEHGELTARGLCFNGDGYIELVEDYTREILTHYPVDALRYDMLFSPKNCTCDGCKKLYKELFQEEFTSWEEINARDSSRIEYQNIATLNRAGDRLIKTARAVKPNVEIWQNHVNTYSEADVNLGRRYDIAYIEFGDPFRLLALRGILDKNAIIVGQTLTNPIRRTIMALGARCYQYIQVDQKTALPADRSWVEDDLAPFYKMVKEVQPYLEDATLPTTIGVVFAENTRRHFPKFDRSEYMRAAEGITMNYLNSSLPLQFVNVLDLDKKDLQQYKLLLLPRTSGLTAGELNSLRNYVRNGGRLLLTGDALLYDESGKQLPDFSLAAEMGVRFTQFGQAGDTLLVSGSDLVTARKTGKQLAASLPDPIRITNLVKIEPVSGTTLVSLKNAQETLPLVHVNKFGSGEFIYIATAGAVALERAIGDRFTGPAPIQVTEKNKKVILARQEKQDRWVMHLLDDGDYEITVDKTFAPASAVIAQYPASGWSYTVRQTKKGLVLHVQGDAKNRVLVLR